MTSLEWGASRLHIMRSKASRQVASQSPKPRRSTRSSVRSRATFFLLRRTLGGKTQDMERSDGRTKRTSRLNTAPWKDLTSSQFPCSRSHSRDPRANPRIPLFQISWPSQAQSAVRWQRYAQPCKQQRTSRSCLRALAAQSRGPTICSTPSSVSSRSHCRSTLLTGQTQALALTTLQRTRGDSSDKCSSSLVPT